MLLEDDIPENFSIKMHTIKDSPLYQQLTSTKNYVQPLRRIQYELTQKVIRLSQKVEVFSELLAMCPRWT